MRLSGWGRSWCRCWCMRMCARGGGSGSCIVNIGREAYALGTITVSAALAAVTAPSVVPFVFPFIVLIFFILLRYGRRPITAPSVSSPVVPTVRILNRLRSTLLMATTSTTAGLLDAAHDALLLCEKVRIDMSLLALVECLLRSTGRSSLLLPMRLRLRLREVTLSLLIWVLQQRT